MAKSKALIAVTFFYVMALCCAFHVPLNSLRKPRRLLLRRSGLIRRQPVRGSPHALAISREETVQRTADSSADEEGDQDQARLFEEHHEEERGIYPGETKVHKFTPAEEAYLRRVNAAPTLYKRDGSQEIFPSVGYDGAFESAEKARQKQYSFSDTVKGEDGVEKTLMRLIVWGGSEEAGKFLSQLWEKAAGSLVSGVYVLWDRRAGSLSSYIGQIDDVNIHELGPQKHSSATSVAEHCYFLSADMLVIPSIEGASESFLSDVKSAVEQRGVTFVGPSVATEVASGEITSFTQLVEQIRSNQQGYP